MNLPSNGKQVNQVILGRGWYNFGRNENVQFWKIEGDEKLRVSNIDFN